MPPRTLALLSSATLALTACGAEPGVPEGDSIAPQAADDVLATDTSVLPPQDTSGQAPPVPIPAPETTAATGAEPLTEPDPDLRT